MRKKHTAPLLWCSLGGTALAAVVQPEEIVHPQLNSSSLGQIGLVGRFEGLSVYDYVGENSVLTSVVSTDNLITQSDPHLDRYLSTSLTDGTVNAACVLQNSSTAFIAGNFTRVRDQTVGGVARLDLNNGEISSLGNISLGGAVNCLWCNDTTVYVGGAFQLGDSQGIGLWNDSSQSWQLPAFGGFTIGSEVRSILETPDNNLLFGGSLSAPLLGSSNTSNVTTRQVGLAAASASSNNGTDASGLFCGSGFAASSGSKDTSVTVDLAQTMYLSKIYLENLQAGGGTKLFRIETSPSSSIMNLTYTDANNSVQFCDAWCPLEENATTLFEFVNVIGSRNMTLFFLDYYGDHAGFQQIKLYTDRSIVNANNLLNAPLDCQGTAATSSAVLQGSWTTNDDFEVAEINGGDGLTSTSVTYYPNITTSGNYSLLLYTPGCSTTGCEQRGQVNVTVYPGPDLSPVSLTVYQTNEYIKYDPIYTGLLSRTADFSPYIEIKPLASQQTPIQFVASQLEVVWLSTVLEINIGALFEFSLENYTTFAANNTFEPVGNTTLNQLGSDVGNGSVVNSLVLANDTIYVGGNFTNEAYPNLIAVSNNEASAISGATNGPIVKLFQYNESVFAIENYERAYTVDGTDWAQIYDKSVSNIVPFNLNGTDTLAFSSPGSNSSLDMLLPGNQSWYNTTWGAFGHLSQVLAYNSSTFYIGSLSIQGDSQTNGAVSVGPQYEVNSLPFEFSNSNSSLVKRETSENAVLAGVYYNDTVNILGGSFTATTSSGDEAQNLLVVDSGNYSTSLPGANDVLSSTSVTSLAARNDMLIIGTESGVYLYNMTTLSFLDDQPITRDGVVSVIARPNNHDILAFGDISENGCSGVCNYDPNSRSWGPLANSSLDGTLVGAQFWSSNILVLLGNGLKVAGGSDTYNLVQYDYGQQQFFPYTGTSINGDVSALVVGRNLGTNSLFMAVSWQNSTSDYNIQWYDGRSWTTSETPISNSSDVQSLSILPIENNSSSSLMGSNMLAINGQIELPNYGNASMVTFDGANWRPLFVATSGGSLGSIGALYSEKQTVISGDTSSPEQGPGGTTTESGMRNLMSTGRIVGISFAIAVGCICLLVVAGLIFGYFTQRSQGYQRAPTHTNEKEMVDNVPPEELMNTAF